jgi:hypothetical protein
MILIEACDCGTLGCVSELDDVSGATRQHIEIESGEPYPEGLWCATVIGNPSDLPSCTISLQTLLTPAATETQKRQDLEADNVIRNLENSYVENEDTRRNQTMDALKAKREAGTALTEQDKLDLFDAVLGV